MDPLLWFRVAIAETISINMDMDGTDTGRQTVKIKAERIEMEIMMGEILSPHQSKIGRWWYVVVSGTGEKI